MSWLWIIGAVWVLSGLSVGVVLGRSIALADRRANSPEAGEWSSPTEEVRPVFFQMARTARTRKLPTSR